MKRVIIILMVAFLAIGCASKKEQTASDASKNLGLDAPDFFLSPPSAEDAIYGVGAAKLADPHKAKDLAENRAREAIARQIETTVKSAMTDYYQEAGDVDSAQAIRFVESISRSIVNTTLVGTKPRDYYASKDGTIYCLIEYNFDNLVSVSRDQFERNEAAAFAEFKADQALERLNYELENNPPSTVVVEN